MLVDANCLDWLKTCEVDDRLGVSRSVFIFPHAPHEYANKPATETLPPPPPRTSVPSTSWRQRRCSWCERLLDELGLFYHRVCNRTSAIGPISRPFCFFSWIFLAQTRNHERITIPSNTIRLGKQYRVFTENIPPSSLSVAVAFSDHHITLDLQAQYPPCPPYPIILHMFQPT